MSGGVEPSGLETPACSYDNPVPTAAASDSQIAFTRGKRADSGSPIRRALSAATACSGVSESGPAGNNSVSVCTSGGAIVVVVERDYGAIAAKMGALGPNVENLGTVVKGITLKQQRTVDHLARANGTVRGGVADGRPRLLFVDAEYQEMINEMGADAAAAAAQRLDAGSSLAAPRRTQRADAGLQARGALNGIFRHPRSRAHP